MLLHLLDIGKLSDKKQSYKGCIMEELEGLGFSGWLRRIFFFLIAFGFLFVGIFQLIWAASVGLKSFQAGEWPTASGTIIASAVRVDRVRGGSAYTPTVSYRYEFAGHAYEGHRITAMDSAEAEQTVNTIVKAFPPGRIVGVYVDPNNPAFAVLKPGFFAYLFSWTALALVATVVGCIGVILLLRSKKAGAH
jgi:hypothetical protein